VPPVRELNPSLPSELDAVFAKALAKDPQYRFGSAAEFVAALRHSLDEAAGATRITAPTRRLPPRARRPRRTRPAWLLPLLGLLLAAGAGGGIAGAMLSGGSTKALPPARPSVSVKTVTAEGTTVTTAAAPPTTSVSDPVALNDQAFSLMKQQNYAAALPLLQQAVQELQGGTDLTTAYANYNLGVTLIALGQCSEAMPYLEVARQIEPDRHEVHDALKAAQHCGKGKAGAD
jgi:tetratricopeptide (TPR) repeat protein